MRASQVAQRLAAAALVTALLLAVATRRADAQLDGEDIGPDLFESEEVLDAVLDEMETTLHLDHHQTKQRKEHRPSVGEHLIAGSVGGVAGAFASYPLDTLRVRLQTMQGRRGQRTGVIGAARAINKESGLGGFYRGVGSPLLFAAVIKSTVFVGYEACQRGLKWLAAKRRGGGEQQSKLSRFELAIAAMGAGALASLVVAPAERVKVLMQTSKTSDGAGGLLSSVRKVVAADGIIGGLFRGLGPTFLREIPGYGVYFIAYEAAKRLLSPSSGDSKDSSGGGLSASIAVRTALAGAFAGVTAWLPVYPVDVVKSRMQAHKQSGWDRRAAPTASAIAAQLWAEEGVMGFYKGLVPTLSRAVISHGTTLAAYEAAVHEMRAWRDKQEDKAADGASS